MKALEGLGEGSPCFAVKWRVSVEESNRRSHSAAAAGEEGSGCGGCSSEKQGLERGHRAGAEVPGRFCAYRHLDDFRRMFLQRPRLPRWQLWQACRRKTLPITAQRHGLKRCLRCSLKLCGMMIVAGRRYLPVPSCDECLWSLLGVADAAAPWRLATACDDVPLRGGHCAAGTTRCACLRHADRPSSCRRLRPGGLVPAGRGSPGGVPEWDDRLNVQERGGVRPLCSRSCATAVQE